MKLLTKEILEKLPPLYANENVEDPIVHLKFFALGAAASWYITEFDGEDTMFGYVTGMAEDELGYISLSELQELRWCGVPQVERDKYFKSTPLSKIKSGEVS